MRSCYVLMRKVGRVWDPLDVCWTRELASFDLREWSAANPHQAFRVVRYIPAATPRRKRPRR